MALIDINKNGKRLSYLEQYYYERHGKTPFHYKVESITGKKAIKVCKVDKYVLTPLPLNNCNDNKSILDFENLAKFRYNVISTELNGRKCMIYDSNKKDWYHLQIGNNVLLMRSVQIIELFEESSKIHN